MCVCVAARATLCMYDELSDRGTAVLYPPLFASARCCVPACCGVRVSTLVGVRINFLFGFLFRNFNFDSLLDTK